MKPRRSDREQKKLAENVRLMRAWKNFHREERDAVLAGPHGAVLSELFRLLENLQFARELISAIEAVDWAAIDTNTRLIVLHEVNAAITRWRERAGQGPIDDALPGQPLRAYQLAKKIIKNFPPHTNP